MADTVTVTSKTTFSNPNGHELTSEATFAFKGTKTITFHVAGKTCNLTGSASGYSPGGCNYRITVAPDGTITGTSGNNGVCTRSNKIASSCVSGYESPVAKWVSAKRGKIPAGAFIVGQESNGQKLYLCRGNYQGGIHPGKISSTLKDCHIGYGGKERYVSPYEVLIAPEAFGKWTNAMNGEVPAGAYVVGHESNGEKLYLCRGNYQGGVHPGKVRWAFKACNINWGGKEVKVNPYEVLISGNGNNGTVEVGKLVWLKNAQCQSSYKTFQQAQQFAASLKDGMCGLTDGSKAGDWRVPSANEWDAMFGSITKNDAMSKFQNVRDGGYWSSTDKNGGKWPASILHWRMRADSIGLQDLYPVWPVRDK